MSDPLPMNIRYQSLPTLEVLRGFVLDALCARDHLDPAQTKLHQARILRSGKPCGLFFYVQGPRLLRSYAIWAGEENRLLLYDSTGQRFGEIMLSEAPDPLDLAA